MIVLFCILLVISKSLNACEITKKITEENDTACTITNNSQYKNLFLNHLIPEELIIAYFYQSHYTNNSGSLKKHFLGYCTQKKQHIIPMPPCAQISKLAKKNFESYYLCIAEHYVELHFLDNIIFLINNLTRWHYEELQGALFQSVYQLDNFFKQYTNRAPLKTILKNEIKKIENISYINAIKERLTKHIAEITFNLTSLNNQAPNALQDTVSNIMRSTQDIQSLSKASKDYVICLKEEIAKNQAHVATLESIMHDYKNQKTTSIKNFNNDTLNLCIQRFLVSHAEAISKKENYDTSYSDNVVLINSIIENIDDLLNTNRTILGFYEVNTHYKTIDDLHKILKKLEKISKYKTRFSKYVNNALLGLIVNVFADYNPIAYQKIVLPKNLLPTTDQPDVDCATIIQNPIDESTYQQTKLGHENQDVPSEEHADFDHIYCAFLRLILPDNKSKELKNITSSKQIAEEIRSFIKLTLYTPVLYQMKALAKQAVVFNPCKEEFLMQLKGIHNTGLLKNVEIIITKHKFQYGPTLEYIYKEGKAKTYLNKPIKFYTKERQYIIPITMAILKNIIANNNFNHLFPENQEYYLYLSNLTRQHCCYSECLAKENIDYISKFLKNYKIIPLITTEKLLNAEECKKENVDAARQFYEEINIGVKIKEWHNILKEIVQKKLSHIDHFFIPTKEYNLDNTYDTIDFICNLFKKVTIQYNYTFTKPKLILPENFFYQMPKCLDYINFLSKKIKNIDWSRCEEINLSESHYQYVLAKKDLYINQFPKNSKYTLNHMGVNYLEAQDRDEFFKPILFFKFILAKSIKDNLLILILTEEVCNNINKILNINKYKKEIQSALQTVRENKNIDTVYIKSFGASSYYNLDNKKLNFLLLKPWAQVIFESDYLGINISTFLDRKLCDRKKIVIKCVDRVILKSFDSDYKEHIEKLHNGLIQVDWSACNNIEIHHPFLNNTFNCIIDIIGLSNNLPCTIIFNEKHYQNQVIMQFHSNDTCKDIISKNNLFIINDNQATLLPEALEIIHTLFLMRFDQKSMRAAFKECIFDKVTAAHIPKKTYYAEDTKDALLLLCKLFSVINVNKAHAQYESIMHIINNEKNKIPEPPIVSSAINSNDHQPINRHNTIQSEAQNNSPSTNSIMNNVILYYLTKIISLLGHAACRIIGTIVYPATWIFDYIIG